MQKGKFAGILLFLMLATSLLQNMLSINLLWISGAMAWFAALLTIERIGRGQRIQISVLLGIGISMMSIALLRESSISLEQAIGQNQPILAMLAAVSFLRLIDRPLDSQGLIPKGRGAFIRTLFGINILAAAINITALIVVCDRLARQSRFSLQHGLMLGRAFSLTVMYSPFIGGMALTLALLPEVSVGQLAMFGIPYVIFGLVINAGLLYLADKTGISTFLGYPLKFESLVFPIILVVLILVLNRMLPDFSVLALIALCAPLLAIITVVIRGGHEQALTKAGNHILQTLPGMAGELWLFLAAGVFAAGITSLTASFDGLLWLSDFDAGIACMTFALILILAIIGIHPIVCVSFLSALLIPHNISQILLAFVFIMGWAIGCTLSPFSGTNLIIQGRYGINNWSLTKGNLFYGGLMFIVGCVFLYLIDFLLLR